MDQKKKEREKKVRKKMIKRREAALQKTKFENRKRKLEKKTRTKGKTIIGKNEIEVDTSILQNNLNTLIEMEKNGDN